jgi:hypothetical protein
MFKRIIAIVVALSFGLASAFAAQAAAPTGKVVAVDGTKIQIVVQGEIAAWMKKGGVVKVSNEAGKILESAAKVTEAAEKTLTLTTKEAAAVKVGDTVSLQKGKVTTGC